MSYPPAITILTEYFATMLACNGGAMLVRDERYRVAREHARELLHDLAKHDFVVVKVGG